MVIHHREVKALPMTFNAVCEIERMGLGLDVWERCDMGLLRAYLAFCLGIEAEEAGELLSAHVCAGGDLRELKEAFMGALEESDFFGALRSRETEAGAGQ